MLRSNPCFIFSKSIYFLSIICLFSSTCKSRSSQIKSGTDNLAGVFSGPIPFCQTMANPSIDPSLKSEPGRFWTHAELQKYIKEAVENSSDEARIDFSYLVIYSKITKLRDEARCNPNSPMHSKDPLNQILMDALADTMTRSLVAMTVACSQSQVLDVDLSGKWCELQKQMRSWDSLRTTLGTIVIYLTLNMGQGLSMLPYYDDLWVDSPYQNKDSRINYLRENFKEHYDANNRFIAQNASQALEKLLEDGFAHKCALDLVSCTRPMAPVFEIFLKITRDNTFAMALKIAEQRTAPNQPRLTKISTQNSGTTPEKFVISGDFKPISNPYLLEKSEQELLSYAKKLMIPISVLSLESIGGKSQRELKTKKGGSN